MSIPMHYWLSPVDRHVKNVHSVLCCAIWAYVGMQGTSTYSGSQSMGRKGSKNGSR